MNKAVVITKSAKDTKFIDCDVSGEVENAGMNTSFIRTTIRSFTNQPVWMKIFEITVGLATIIGTVLAVFQWYFK